jgi:hypothetical protein
VELFVPLHAAAAAAAESEVDLDLFVLEENIENLINLVKQNTDCLNFDTISKHIIILLSDKERIDERVDRALNCIQTPRVNENTGQSGDGAALYASICSSSAQHICHFLKRLSDSHDIETFRDHCGTVEHEELPVQQYRSFKECNDREWRTIKLLQIACVQLLNLKHPAVIPDLLVILSSLSTQQVVPYSYWSQAIQLCSESKKWEDLKVLLQVG